MTYLPGCPHCIAKRRENAVRLSDPTPWNGGGGETSASGPSASPSFHSPLCIAGCGRPVPVHGETCDWCWRYRAQPIGASSA